MALIKHLTSISIFYILISYKGSFADADNLYTCADIFCEVPIAIASTSLAYHAPSKDHLSFRRNQDVYILSKPVNGVGHWIGKLQNKIGLIPQNLLRETKVLTKKLEYKYPFEYLPLADKLGTTEESSTPEEETKKENNLESDKIEAENDSGVEDDDEEEESTDDETQEEKNDIKPMPKSMNVDQSNNILSPSIVEPQIAPESLLPSPPLAEKPPLTDNPSPFVSSEKTQNSVGEIGPESAFIPIEPTPPIVTFEATSSENPTTALNPSFAPFEPHSNEEMNGQKEESPKVMTHVPQMLKAEVSEDFAQAFQNDNIAPKISEENLENTPKFHDNDHHDHHHHHHDVHDHYDHNHDHNHHDHSHDHEQHDHHHVEVPASPSPKAEENKNEQKLEEKHDHGHDHNHVHVHHHHVDEVPASPIPKAEENKNQEKLDIKHHEHDHEHTHEHSNNEHQHDHSSHEFKPVPVPTQENKVEESEKIDLKQEEIAQKVIEDSPEQLTSNFDQIKEVKEDREPEVASTSFEPKDPEPMISHNAESQNHVEEVKEQMISAPPKEDVKENPIEIKSPEEDSKLPIQNVPNEPSSSESPNIIEENNENPIVDTHYVEETPIEISTPVEEPSIPIQNIQITNDATSNESPADNIKQNENESIENKNDVKGTPIEIMPPEESTLKIEPPTDTRNEENENIVNEKHEHRKMNPLLEHGHKFHSSDDPDCKLEKEIHMRHRKKFKSDSNNSFIIVIKYLSSTLVSFLPEYLSDTIIDVNDALVFTGIIALTLISICVPYFFFETFLSVRPLKKRVTDLNKTLWKVSAAYESQQDEYDTFKKKALAYDENKKQIEELELDIYMAKKEEERLKEENKSLKKRLKVDAKVAGELDSLISTTMSERDKTVEERDKLKSLVLSLQSDLSELRVDYENLSLDASNTLMDLELMSHKKENEEMRASAFEKEIGELKSKLHSELNCRREMENEVEGLKEEKRSLFEQLVDLKEVLHKYENTVVTMTDEISLKENELLALREAIGEDSPMLDIAEISAKLKSSQTSADSLQSRLDSLTIENTRLTHDLESCKVRLSVFGSEKEAAETRLQVLENYFKEKEEELRKMVSKYETEKRVRGKDKEELIEMIEEKTREISDLNNRLDTLLKEYEETKLAHRNEIRALESKGHETFLSLCQSERKAQDVKKEAELLRQKLTALIKAKEQDIDGSMNGEMGYGLDLDDVPLPLESVPSYFGLGDEFEPPEPLDEEDGFYNGENELHRPPPLGGLNVSDEEEETLFSPSLNNNIHPPNYSSSPHNHSKPHLLQQQQHGINL